LSRPSSRWPATTAPGPATRVPVDRSAMPRRLAGHLPTSEGHDSSIQWLVPTPFPTRPSPLILPAALS
jgi:hypothetical protein